MTQNRKLSCLCLLCSILVMLCPKPAHSFPADFDGDGKNDFVVWRQPAANWYVWPSTYSVSHSCPPHFQQISGASYLGCVAQWGLPGDKVLSGNYDHDGLADLVVWRPSTGTWWIKFSSYDGVVGVQFGLPNDIPDEVNADITDAVSDLVVFRPSTLTWYVRSSIPPSYPTSIYLGGRMQTGRVDPLYAASAIYDPLFDGTPNGPAYFSNAIDNKGYNFGVWSIVLMENQVSKYYEKTVHPTTSSLTSFIPVIGNFGGQASDKADYAMWDKNNGTWSLYYNGGIPNGVHAIPWGLPGDIPLGGDYDGDGITDFTVWRGAGSGGWEGTWFVKPSSGQCPSYMTPISGGGCYKQWGLSGDVPVS
ncbi:FG-GAP repeat domain-containing protein [Candidatus Contendibacter odensensis]|uniref:VCBS repeat-containing protein n=1 Tax=Candidatus Contendobacter odensis Run_B_J11 TaxID=1400861 RepID=A0A7U7J2N2_9GAMM|nr:VCBS repeat-containing protein [Candidatus Contendobacter odensis]CDH44337.1 exported hypothetical protein [Candidatus Contendobacter odensis Run_B_J11]